MQRRSTQGLPVFLRTALSLALSAAAGPLIGAAGAAAQDTQGGALEEIVVTATKRTTVLMDTPESITAISGSVLTEMGAQGFQDVVKLAPNVSFTETYGNARINIRGIGNVFYGGGGDPGVAFYSDGSYVSDQTTSNTGVFDIERVEILRGPQGALYGRNATGGAVNYITRKPTDDFEAQLGFLGGDHGRKETAGYVSGPLGQSDTSARLSYDLKQHDGYTDNTIGGNAYGPVVAGDGSRAPDDLDDLDARSVRLQTSTDFGEAGKLRLIGSYYKRDDNGPNAAILPQPVLNSILLFGVAPGDDRDETQSNGASQEIEVKWLQAIYERELAGNTLTVTASHRDSSYDQFLDGDSTAALVASNVSAIDNTDQSIDVHLTSGDSGAWQWLVGANYLFFDQSFDVNYQQLISAKILIPTLPAFIKIPSNFISENQLESRSMAVYADVRYALSPTLAVRGGLRLNRDEKDSEEYRDFRGIGTLEMSNSWDSVPGSIGLEWNLSDSTLAYGKVSYGFKSGAVNLGALQPDAVDPETVVSGEVGAKTSFLDDRAQFSVALFSSDYEDMQVTQFVNNTLSLVNAPRAQINGMELELLMRPVDALTLGINMGLMDPEYEKFNNLNTRDPAAGTVSVSGNQLQNVSRAQANINATYVVDVRDYEVSFRADYAWRDKYYFTEFNDNDTKQSAYGIVDLAASIQPHGGTWMLYAHVKNAADETVYSSMTQSGIPNAGARAATYNAPRNYGIGVEFYF